jgi:hypothetical protein
VNAYELADAIEDWDSDGQWDTPAAEMLREQADKLAKYEQVLMSIANEYVELSHDKIRWQCEDHIKWAKEALK